MSDLLDELKAHYDPLELVGRFRFCPACGHPVLARDDFGVTPEARVEEHTLESLQEIRCGTCYLPWTSCPCSVHSAAHH